MKIAFTSLAIAVALVAQAQEAPVVKVTLPASAKPGTVVKGTLTMTFVEGWHGYQNPPLDPYQNPVTLTLATKGWKLQKVAYPKGIVMDMAGSKAAVYEGEVKIPFEIVVPKKLGKATLEFSVAYQQCNDSTCLPPGSTLVKSILTVAKK